MKPFNTQLHKAINEQSLRKVWEKANAYHNNTDLSLGNPVGLPPKKIINALIKILQSDMDEKFFGYINNAGIEQVRKIIAQDLIKQKIFPETLNHQHIVITTGASGAHSCIFKTIINPGDEVIVLKPFFPDFPRFIENHGGKVKYVELQEPNFKLNIEQINQAITSKTKAIIINSPNNPTGQIYSKTNLQKLARLLRKYQKNKNQTIFIISDEVYRDIVYQPYEFVSPCAFYDNSFMAYSFSKSLYIPGERIGYVAIHPDMIQADQVFEMLKLSNRILGFVNAPALMQRVFKNALPINFNLEDYQYKRDKLVDALTRADFDFVFPKGAFYILVKIPIDKNKFYQLLDQLELTVIPSEPFGIENYFRIAYCQNDQTIEDACQKIDKLSQLINQ